MSPVVHRPTELVDQGRHEQRRVGYAAGDRDVGASRQRGDDRSGAKIRVGRNHAIAERRQRSAALFEPEVGSVHHGKNVVADHGGDLHAGQPHFPRELGDLARGAERVGRAHVRHDPNALFTRDREHRPHAQFEQRVVAERLVLDPRALRQCDGPLGQAFEDEIVETPVSREFDGRLDPVAGVSRAGADTNGLHVVIPMHSYVDRTTLEPST